MVLTVINRGLPTVHSSIKFNFKDANTYLILRVDVVNKFESKVLITAPLLKKLILIGNLKLVLRLAATNQSALFQSSIIMLPSNLFCEIGIGTWCVVI